MAIHQVTRNKIIDLYYKEHLPIREIAKITRKSSRDIISVLRTHELQEKEEEKNNINSNNIPDSEQKEEGHDNDDKNLAPYTKAYKLFTEGKRPIQAAIILRLPEAEVTKYYIEYLRMTQLPELPQMLKEIGIHGISYFLILTQKAMAEKMKTDQVINLLKLTNDKLPKLEGQIEKLKNKLLVLEYEIEDHKELLYFYNEKITNAKLNLEEWRKSWRVEQEKFVNAYNENQKLEKLAYEFKNNNKVYLEIQNIAEERVKSFLGDNNAMKLLEFAIAAVTEALRQDPQRVVLIEKTPPIQNYDFNPSSVAIEQSPFRSPYDDYPHFARDKILELSSKYYNELVKGISCTTISTISRIGETDSSSYYSFLKPSHLSNQGYDIHKDMAESDVHEKCKGDIAP
jgi:hypothetical protein